MKKMTTNELSAKYVPTIEVQNMVFNHGLAAFSKGYSVDLKAKTAIVCFGWLKKEEEISVSEKRIGPIGLILKGKVTVVFKRDINSEKDRSDKISKRYFYDYDLKEVITTKKEIEENKSYAYCEAFMKNVEVVGAWVDKRYINNEELMGKIYKYTHNIEVVNYGDNFIN